MKGGEIFGHKRPSRTYEPGKDIWVLPQDYIGIEYEVENYGSGAEKVSEYFHIKADGSLRDAGAEFILTQPLFGKDLWDAVVAFEALAKEKKYTFGERTSTHIHMDARDIDQKELHKLAVLYAVFEKSLFRFCNQHSVIARDASNFCVPWYRSSAYFEYLSTLEKDNVDNIKVAFARMDRYSALNYAALRQHGSIEFRHLGGTCNSTVVAQWINLLMCLKQAAKTYNAEGYDLLVRLSVLGPQAFARYIFGNRLEVTHGDIRNGILVAQELLTAGQFLDWENPVLKQANKDKVGLGEEFIKRKKVEAEKKEEGPDPKNLRAAQAGEDLVPGPADNYDALLERARRAIADGARLGAARYDEVFAVPPPPPQPIWPEDQPMPVVQGGWAQEIGGALDEIRHIPPPMMFQTFNPDGVLAPVNRVTRAPGEYEYTDFARVVVFPPRRQYEIPPRLRGVREFDAGAIELPLSIRRYSGVVRDIETGRYYVPGIGIFNHLGERLY